MQCSGEEEERLVELETQLFPFEKKAKATNVFAKVCGTPAKVCAAPAKLCGTATKVCGKATKWAVFLQKGTNVKGGREQRNYCSCKYLQTAHSVNLIQR